MVRLRVLPPKVVAHIAAGQVIDYPVSIVKELLENALDAHAHTIRLSLEEGGNSRIIMADDGVGMTKEELQLCAQAHTTSKLQSVEDLSDIRTYGFRGEGLASITHVSRMKISSRCWDDPIGWTIEKRGKIASEPTPSGMRPGTSISIDQLFEEIPARKKFLRAASTERKSILQLIHKYLLTMDDVGIQVYDGTKEIFSCPRNRSREERLGLLLGDDVAASAFFIETEVRGAHIVVYLAHPKHARKSMSYGYVIVNGRPVALPECTTTIKEAYGSLLEPRFYPEYAVFITADPRDVDCNIDPKKQRVQLLHQNEILRALQEAIIKAIRTPFSVTTDPGVVRDRSMDTYSAALAREDKVLWTPHTRKSKNKEVLQVFNTYLIYEENDRLFLFDQHAAHERILFDQIQDDYYNKHSQPILLEKPQLCELSARDIHEIEELLPLFRNIGFAIDIFNNSTLRVDAVPQWAKRRSLRTVLTACLDDILSSPIGHFTSDQQTHLTLSYVACRSAIKAGDLLSSKEREALLNKVLTLDHHYTCPHGRPLVIELTRTYFEKLFKRT
ncbi:MAG: DNA mismatch repair protein MutL [Microgenomates bacterium OLB22]|nr:MAG: DNA mismatch repair protein MutL [Microgenomates bacterium OLB22]